MPATLKHVPVYDEQYVTRLFTEMSGSYDVVNLISSFGFSEIWRAQCVRSLPLRPGQHVADFMAGSGECWPYLWRRIRGEGKIFSVDICPAMCRRQERRARRYSQIPVQVRCENALETGLPENSMDHVVSAFGLKTFDATQTRRLIAEIFRVLRPGGSCSLLEISVPPSRLLQILYLFYIGRVIPWVGRIFLKNIECYRMLGVYTAAFRSCEHLTPMFVEAGFLVKLKRHVFGCATSIVATKP